MRLFCREDHTTKIENRDIVSELTEARAKLARLKKLPLSAFAEKTHKSMKYTPFGPMVYSVDNRDDAIARAEADVAELEVLAAPINSKEEK